MNLHRADLTALERDEHIAEWIELVDHEANASQVATHKKRGQQPGGINAASRDLGIEFVECIVLEGTDAAARMWEIAENLHRAELTVLERDEHIAEWIELAELQSAQVAPIESRRGDRRGHRPASGINAASRDLGIDRTEAQRAVKVAALAPECFVWPKPVPPPVPPPPPKPPRRPRPGQ